AALFNNALTDSGVAGSLWVSADSLPGLASDYNALMANAATTDGSTVQTLAQWRAATGQDAHSFTTTPFALFVDYWGHGVTLAPGGPGVGAGTASLAGR